MCYTYRFVLIRMRSILIICALVTVAAACPTNMDCDCGCDTDINWPSIVPRTWKVKKFDSQYVSYDISGPLINDGQ